MGSLTYELISAKTKGKDFDSIKKLNCWALRLNNVSLLKELQNVEILTLSVNEIDTLKDIQYCANLVELYIRDNKIKNLDEIFYLKNLKNLKILWLADNECCNDSNEDYRLTVLRNLPNLVKLDNAPVTNAELESASKHGRLIESEPCVTNGKISEKDESENEFNSTIFSSEVKKLILPLNNENNFLLYESSQESLKTDLIFSNSNTETQIDTEIENLNLNDTSDLLDLTDLMKKEDFNNTDKNEFSNDPSEKSFEQSSNEEKFALKESICKSNSNISSQSLNVLPAILLLLNDLNIESLDKLMEACEERKSYLKNIKELNE